ncbi:HesB/IscA family protein [Thermodesulfobacteriota bacterium]
MNINILEKARKMLESRLEPDQFLRVAITDGGCAGLTYKADIDREMRDDESVIFESSGIRIVSDHASSGYLHGLTIDYSDELINGGLKFSNYNAGTTCGCGQSFNLTGFPITEIKKCN